MDNKATEWMKEESDGHCCLGTFHCWVGPFLRIFQMCGEWAVLLESAEFILQCWLMMAVSEGVKSACQGS